MKSPAKARHVHQPVTNENARAPAFLKKARASIEQDTCINLSKKQSTSINLLEKKRTRHTSAKKK